MASIAIIPARGGSKRIPGKNIRSFCGRPIINYSIKAALESNIFDEVMVSTDSEKIAAIARQAGASVPFVRSADNSNDTATTDDVLTEVIQRYRSQGKEFDLMCCIYPTAPFVTQEKLREAVRAVINDAEADSLLTVVKFSFPPQRASIVRGGYLEYQYPEYALTRSQDLEPVYHDAGQFYFYKLDRQGAFKTKRRIPWIVPETEVQDIDNETDWVLAEMKYRGFIMGV